MRSDTITRHMKIHLKFTPKEGSDNICKEILLDLVDKVLEEKISDVNIKCSEHDAYLEPAIKRKCYEIEALRKTLIEQTEEYKDKIALGADIYKILNEGKVEEGALAKDLKDALDLYMKQGEDLNRTDAV